MKLYLGTLILEIQKKAVIEIIDSFEKKANELIHLLAASFHLDLNSKYPFEKLLSIQNDLKKGNIEDNWTYWFHGSHCDFENKTTKQYLHVSIISEKNHGAIDSFYLYKFFITTQSLSHFQEIISNENQFFKIVDDLKIEGKLIDKSSFPFSIWVRNQNLEA